MFTYLSLTLLVALSIGSFINVVVYRLPLLLQREWEGEAKAYLGINQTPVAAKPFNLMLPASHCPQCKAPVKPWHNIPVLSYLLLRGRCANCSARISLQYPAVELLCGVLSLAVVLQMGFTPAAGLALIFTWTLLALALIDTKSGFLLDNLTLPLMWLGLLVNTQGVFTSLSDAVIGAAVGYLSLWSVYWLFKLVRGKEGLGYGDFKMLAALGAWVGWQGLPIVTVMSFTSAASLGLFGIAFGLWSRHKAIPFGPFLAAAGWLALVYELREVWP